MPGCSGFLFAATCFLSFSSTLAEVVPFLDPGFFFDFNEPGEPVPIPTTQQCQTLHVKWSRSSATGPSPVAPYSMHIYTSKYIVPFVVDAGLGLSTDWPVPFPPGTQFQACMFDKNGVSGGCQDKYTVTPNITVPEPSCQNVTFPKLLEVEATVPGGPLSQFGFIDQCMDISVKPKIGKPPFTMTIAPSLHPAFNLTSNNMDPLVWTVSLGRASQFFMTMASSDGFKWSFGPLHAGLDNRACLKSPGLVPKGQAIGAGFGGAATGAVLTALIFVLFGLYKKRKEKAVERTISSYPQDMESTAASQAQRYLSPTDEFGTISSPRPRAARRGTDLSSSTNHVYVVHHDGGPPPVTVYTQGAPVTELPPVYLDGISEGSNSLTPSPSPLRPEKSPNPGWT